MTIQLLMACHVIFMVTWFAGLFYIGRLFVYHVEALSKSEIDREVLIPQYQLMEKRLWFGITWPGMLLTIFFGVWLAYETKAYLYGWFHLKLVFILGLVLYHLQTGRLRKRLLTLTEKTSALKYRFYNEIPVLFLVLIILTVYLKDVFNGLWILSVFSLFSMLLILGILVYKKKRKG